MAYLMAIERHMSDLVSFQKVVVAPVQYQGWSTHNELVGKYNPSNKIPCLILNPNSSDNDNDSTSNISTEQAIFDSRVICEYFDSFSPEYSLSRTNHASFFGDKTLLAAVNGGIDAEILVVYEERLRAEKGILYPEWVTGMRQKVFRAVDYLVRAVQTGQLRVRGQNQSVSTGEVGAAVFLAFLDARGLEWRKGRDGLRSWFDGTWVKRVSFVNTDPGADHWTSGVPGPLGRNHL